LYRISIAVASHCLALGIERRERHPVGMKGQRFRAMI
jgi:hypothetical protein